MIACQFGLCRRPAELSVDIKPDVVPVAVCGLHVSAVISWGLPEPTYTLIQILAPETHSAERPAPPRAA